VIDLRDEQSENVFDSMCVNSESVSNEIEKRDRQYKKHSEQRIRRLRGIVIDLREEHTKNAFDSMRINSESVSNEIDESDLQDEKDDKQRI
jgi:hypothetical protein